MRHPVVERQHRNLAARLEARLGVKDISGSMARRRWDALRPELPPQGVDRLAFPAEIAHRPELAVASELPVLVPLAQRPNEPPLVTLLVRRLPAQRPALLQLEVSLRQLALCRALQQAHAEGPHPDAPIRQQGHWKWRPPEPCEVPAQPRQALSVSPPSVLRPVSPQACLSRTLSLPSRPLPLLPVPLSRESASALFRRARRQSSSSASSFP